MSEVSLPTSHDDDDVGQATSVACQACEDGDWMSTRKPSARQRKATLVAKPYHPEPAAAYASLMDPASARAGLKGGCDVRNIKKCFGLLFFESRRCPSGL
jgi:hypothetical protein